MNKYYINDMMKKMSCFITSMLRSGVILLLLFLCIDVSAQAPLYKNGMREGRIVVKFKNNPELMQEVKTTLGKQKMRGQAIPFAKAPELSKISQQIMMNEMQPLFTANPRFEKRFKNEGLDRWFVISYSSNQSPLAVVEAIKGIKEVEKVEPDFQLAPPTYSMIKAKIPLSVKSTTEAVNDPLYPKQWHYHNTGQTGGMIGADINLPEAWKKRMTANNVIVAIMDQGVDHSHEDLRDNMWYNQKELTGASGVDDDGNGYIDDVYGFDFGNGYGQIAKGEHGTHVAGTVAAVSNNGIGVAGVAGGDGKGNGARIMTLPIFGSDQERSSNSFIYAADNGALISQNSWGYSVPDMSSEAYEAAIRYFVKYAGCDNEGSQLPNSLMKGGVVIFASGNMSSMGKFYPACMEEVIAVSSITQVNAPASYTNYDTWVDVVSYGGEIMKSQETGVLSTVPGNQYGYMQGTSMACPHVSGMACLALAELGGNGFTNTMLRNYLTLTVRNNDSEYDSQYKGYMGKGIVDALKALMRNDGVPPLKITDLQVSVVADSYIEIRFTTPAKPDGSSVEGYRVKLKSTGSESKEFSFSTTKKPGDKEVFLTKGLNANVNYDLTVESYDVWGVTSLPTDLIKLKTSLSKGNLTYTAPLFTTIRKQVDYATSKTWEFDIEVSNNAKDESAGGVFWRADGYPYSHINNIPSWAMKSKSGVEDSSESPVSTPLSVVSEGNLITHGNVYTDAGYKKWISHRRFLAPDQYIGEAKENGVMHPSSAAIKFVVPEVYKEGFSLSHFDLALRTSRHWLYDEELKPPADLKVTFEVYRGGELPKIENRIYTGSLTDMPDANIRVITLPFVPFFEKGESFWIVVHADQRYMYPLGVSQKGTQPDNSLYSSDGGKSWTPLYKVYNAVEKPVFTISALSDGKGGKSPMVITPSSGFLAKGQKQKLKAVVDLTNIKEGQDSTLVIFNTDGTLQAGRNKLTAVLELKRNDVKAAFGNELYEYGMISLGDKPLKKIKIFNNGMGQFKVDSITLSNKKDFRISSIKLPEIIMSGDSAEIEVEFLPATLGAKNTQLIVWGRGINSSTLLVGTCVEAPQASFSPSTLNLNMTGNEERVVSFDIRNTSNYALSYSIPEFSQKKTEALKIEEPQTVPSVQRTDTLDATFGYKWQDSHMGKAYQGSPWREISETGIELTERCDGMKKYTKVNLPFTFRYYNRVLKSIYVGVNGTLRCDTITKVLSVPVFLPYKITDEDNTIHYSGLIAPLWILDGTTGHFPSTRFYYQVFEDCVVFQFTGSETYLTENGTKSNYQVAIYPDGSFEYRYKEIFKLKPVIGNSFLIGWSSPDGKDGKSIYFQDRNIQKEITGEDYCIKVTPPVFSPFVALENELYSGIVKPLSSKTINLKINSKELPAGNSANNLKIQTNDPANINASMLVNFTKTDQLQVEFTESKIDLGSMIFENQNVEKEISIFNTSKSDGRIRLELSNSNGIAFQGGASMLELDVKGNSSRLFKIQLLQTADAQIFAKSIDGTSTFDTLTVKAKESTYKNINSAILDKKELFFDLKGGESKTEVIQVTADEKGYKSKLFLPGFLTTSLAGAAKQEGKTVNDNSVIDFGGYRWMSSESSSAPQFIWNDISKTGTRLNLSQDMVYNGHELPFKFPFYGVEYSKIFVSPNGRISPYPLGWDIMWDFVPPVRMPDQSITNPLISIMWCRQWYSDSNKDGGIYYDINSERMIIQYHQFQYDWVVSNGMTSYQVIIYKDGTVQFVYKDLDNCDLKNQVTIGMQGKGQSATEGYTYTLTGSKPIHSNTTITAKPMYGPYTVEAGQQIQLNLTANSSGYKGGDYEDKVIFMSENMQVQNEIPVHMKVGTSANLTSREKLIDFGRVITGTSIDQKPVTLLNGGNLDLSINKINFTGNDASLFTIKKQVTVINGNDAVEIKYEDLNYPVVLKAFSSETFYVFATPKSETKQNMAEMIVETSFNNLNIPVKIYSMKPAELSIVSETGASNIDINLANQQNVFTKKAIVKYVEGESEVEFDLNLQVENKPIAQPTKAMRAKAPNYGPFQAVAIKSQEIPKAIILNAKPQAISTEKIVPFGSVSLIKDNVPQAMIGAGNLGNYYGLSACVKMNTEEKGFLMSHVRFYTNTIGRDTSKVIVRIYNDCERPSRESLIYEKEHQLKMSVSLAGEIYLPLEHNIAFGPHQDFWVELYFGVKLQMPVAVAKIPDGITDDRNYYRLFNAQKETWSDFYPYPNYFAIWAIQESYTDVTNWLTLNADSKKINPQQSVNVSMDVNTLHFPMSGINLALGAKTNVLANVKPLLITTTKYVEPKWTQYPVKPMLIREGTETSFVVKAEDPNGLPITYALTSPVEGVKIKAQPDGSALVTYSAPYTASYVSNLNIEARTSKGVSVHRVSIANINVNRTPKALPVIPITLSLNSMNPVTLPVSYFFVDPDGDQMQFSGNIASNGIALNLTEKGFVFTPIYEDGVDVVLTATDGEFQVSTKFRVNVVRPLNNPPTLIKPLENRAVQTGKGFDIDLLEYFKDQEDDVMSFEVWATNKEVATVSVKDSVMTVVTLNPGLTAIAIKAKDSNRGETLVSFAIKAVGENVNNNPAEMALLSIAPNPSNVQATIVYSGESNESTIYCIVRDLSGKTVATEMMTQLDNKNARTVLPVQNYQPGVYVVQIVRDGKVMSTEKLIVTKQ